MQYRLPKNVLLQTYGKNIDIRYVSDTSCTIALSTTLKDIYSIENYNREPIQFRINNAGNLSSLYIGADSIYSDHNVEFEIAEYDIGKDECWFNRSYIDKGYFTNINSSVANIESIYCRDITANVLIIDDLQLQNLSVYQIMPTSTSSKIGDSDNYFGEIHTNALMLHNMDDDNVSFRAEVHSESMESELNIYSALPTNATINGDFDLDIAGDFKISTQGNQEEIVFLETDSQSETLLFKAPTTRIQSSHNNEYLRVNITNQSADFSFVSNSSSSGIILSGETVIQNSLDVTDILFRYDDLTTQGTITNKSNFYGTIYLKKGSLFQLVLCFDSSIMTNIRTDRIYFSGTPLQNIVSFLTRQNSAHDKFHLGLAIKTPKPGWIDSGSPTKTYLYDYLRAKNLSTYTPFDSLQAIILESIILTQLPEGTKYLNILCMYTGDSMFLTVSTVYYEIVHGGYIFDNGE